MDGRIAPGSPQQQQQQQQQQHYRALCAELIFNRGRVRCSVGGCGLWLHLSAFRLAVWPFCVPSMFECNAIRRLWRQVRKESAKKSARRLVSKFVDHVSSDAEANAAESPAAKESVGCMNGNCNNGMSEKQQIRKDHANSGE